MSSLDAAPVEGYRNLIAANEVTFVLFYRGHWCPFCVNHMKQLVAITPQIREAGGDTLIVTAESAEFLPAMIKSTGYNGHTLNDPELQLVNQLKTDDVLELAITPKDGYPKGMSQPGLLVISKNGEVLESWHQVPSMSNLGGAKDRPDLREVWENAQAKLRNEAAPHTKYHSTGFMGMMVGKVFG